MKMGSCMDRVGFYLDRWAFIWKMGLWVVSVGLCKEGMNPYVGRVGLYLDTLSLIWTYGPQSGR